MLDFTRRETEFHSLTTQILLSTITISLATKQEKSDNSRPIPRWYTKWKPDRSDGALATRKLGGHYQSAQNSTHDLVSSGLDFD